jgi:glutaredoxin
MFSLLRKWLGHAPTQRADLQIIMYTRENCHLCEDAWTLLVARQKARGFSLRKIDVDTSPDLAAQHGTWVPVVTVNGQVRFRGGINEVLLERLLNAS